MKIKFFDKIFRKTKKPADPDQRNILLSEDIMQKMSDAGVHSDPRNANILIISGAGDKRSCHTGYLRNIIAEADENQDVLQGERLM